MKSPARPTLLQRLPILGLMVCLAVPSGLEAQDAAFRKRMAGFDQYMAQVLKDWNAPGIGVGIVVKDKLVFARGYGYRDFGNKLPFTPTTVVPIASNTKLFTATAMGLLVDEGRIEWDKPVRQFVPQVAFYNDELNATITMRDMLAHRTGITRHDLIWYKSDFTREELFQRLKYLEPKEPPRTLFLYNNLMYAAAGQIIELLSGQPWERFVETRLFGPLRMTSTVYSIDDVLRLPDHGVPYTERRDSDELYQIPYYREQVGVGPAGSINSNIEDLSHWLIAQMNGGRFEGRQVIPAAVIKATRDPAIALQNTTLETRGWGELLNAAYGMARMTAVYRGHLLTYHGGDINGFHSQVSSMPYDSIGVIVLVIGDHAAPLYNVVSYNVYERLLGLSQTPWSARINEARRKGKAAGTESRAHAGAGQVQGTRPSHPLDDYVGDFGHPAYGIIHITRPDSGLFFDFHHIRMPLTHFHYERFDTPDDEQDGKWSITFSTSPQGEVDRAVVSVDEGEVAFIRQVPAALADPATLRQYAGQYLTPSGAVFSVVLQENGTLGLDFAGQPFQALSPWQTHRFKVKEFSDVTFEFVLEDGRVTALKQIDPSGEYIFRRK